MATTIPIENDKFTIITDHKNFKGKVWSRRLNEAIAVRTRKKYTRHDSRLIAKNNFTNTRLLHKEHPADDH